jgi:tetratricopeptide (TPR) repeat protein
MQDKLKCYEEALAIDPGSKLFFPLAKLYLDNEQIEKAEEVLKSGLERYPEHLEARLLLANIYFLRGQEKEGEKICVDMFSLLKKNMFFWSVLERFFDREGDVDLALAFRFLALHAKGEELTWSKVLKAGILALEKEDSSAQRSECSRVETGQLRDREIDDDKQIGIPHDEEPADQIVAQSEVGVLVDADREIREIDEEFDDVEEVKDLNFEQEARTRSLADLLFEQEEYAKALDIYEELWRASLPGTERKDLENRIKEIKELLADGESSPEQKLAVESDSSDSNEEAISEKNDGQDEVIDFLSRLAERLEARAAAF